MKVKSVKKRLCVLVIIMLVIFSGLRFVLGGIYAGMSLVIRFINRIYFSSIIFEIFLLVLAFTLTDAKKMNDVMKEQNDSFLYQVTTHYRLRAYGLLVVILGFQNGFFLSVGMEEKLKFSPILLLGGGILLGAYILLWWFIKGDFNFKVLVGKKVIVVCNRKGETKIYTADEISCVEKQYQRKARVTRFFFSFPNGEFSVKEEDGFEAKCLIAFLQDKYEKKNMELPISSVDSFEKNKKEYRIETSSGIEICEVEWNKVMWKAADRDLSEKVHKEARFDVIVMSVFGVFIGMFGFGIITALLDFSWTILGVYLVGFCLIYFYIIREDVWRCKNKLYMLQGKVVNKYEIVKKYSLWEEKYYLDVEIENGVGVKEVLCPEHYFRTIQPGQTMVVITKTDKSTPKVFCND